MITKTKKDRREGRETSGGDPKIRVRWRGSSTCAPGSGPRIAFAKNLRGQGSRLSAGQAEGWQGDTAGEEDPHECVWRWRLPQEGKPCAHPERDQVFIGKTNGSSCRKSRPKPLIQPHSSTRATPCANAMRKASPWVMHGAGKRFFVEELSCNLLLHVVPLVAWQHQTD